MTSMLFYEGSLPLDLRVPGSDRFHFGKPITGTIWFFTDVSQRQYRSGICRAIITV